MTESGSVIVRDSKGGRLMRLLLRRQPWLLISFVECCIMALLIVAVLAFAKSYRDCAQQIADIHHHIQFGDQQIYNELANSDCHYEPIPHRAEDYDQRLCSLLNHNLKPLAYAEQTASSAKCMSYMHSVECHSTSTIPRFTSVPSSLMEERITPCAGYNRVAMPQQLITSDQKVIASRISNRNLRRLLNRNVFSSDLIIKCPRCRVSSTYYAKNKPGLCAHRIETLEEGWPIMARYCDYEQTVLLDIGQSIYCNI